MTDGSYVHIVSVSTWVPWECYFLPDLPILLLISRTLCMDVDILFFRILSLGRYQKFILYHIHCWNYCRKSISVMHHKLYLTSKFSFLARCRKDCDLSHDLVLTFPGSCRYGNSRILPLESTNLILFCFPPPQVQALQIEFARRSLTQTQWAIPVKSCQIVKPSTLRWDR